MDDESLELRWRRLGYTSDEQPLRSRKSAGKGELRPRLTRKSNPQTSTQDPASQTLMVDPLDQPAKLKSKAGSGSDGQPSATSTSDVPSAGTTATDRGGGSKVMRLADRRQRCVVKVNYVRHRSGASHAAPLDAHARYLEREDAGASDPFGQGYLTRHGQDLFGHDGKRLKQWQSDRHHFRLVISPEHGAKLDLPAFTTRYMQELELRLYHANAASSSLEWAAVTHHNTDHPHAHVVLRGQTQDGRDLVIPKRIMAHGLRELGRDLVTEELGYRPQHEIEQDRSRQIRLERFTELDQEILDKTLGRGQNRGVNPADLDDQACARLDWLIERGLAKHSSNDQDSVKLDPTLETQLRACGEERDIVRQLQRGSTDQEALKRYSMDMMVPPITGQVEHLASSNEIEDRFTAVIREPADPANGQPGQGWLVELSHGQAERLKIGDQARLSTTRTLPSGKTTRSPFIRVETLPKAPAVEMPLTGLLQSVSQIIAPATALPLSQSSRDKGLEKPSPGMDID